MNKRKTSYTYEEVKEYIESFGYKLLSKEYINNKKKLKILCPKGHNIEMCFDVFKNAGCRCKFCNHEKLRKERSYSIEEVKEYIENEGYKLLSEKYTNNKGRILISCNNGHKYYTTFDNFKNKSTRCPYCSGNAKLTYEEVKEYIERAGYKLLSTEYKNANTKIKIQCDKGHEYEVLYGSFQQGHRCPCCHGRLEIEYNYENVKEYVESFNYELLSTEYINAHTKLLTKCPKGHIYEVSFTHFKYGNRCPTCGISKGEQKIMDYLNGENIKYIYNKPYFNDLIGVKGGLLRPDFIIEDKKIWIEYDGEFHFENKMNEDGYKILQEHDKLKNEYAKRNN